MKVLNRQKAFDAAVAGLRKQGAFSFKENEFVPKTCLYKSPNGNRCAVGFLLQEEKIRNLEELGADDPAVLSALKPDFLKDEEASIAQTSVDGTFLSKMQGELHDAVALRGEEFNKDDFEVHVEQFAETYGLEVPPL